MIALYVIAVRTLYEPCDKQNIEIERVLMEKYHCLLSEYLGSMLTRTRFMLIFILQSKSNDMALYIVTHNLYSK